MPASGCSLEELQNNGSPSSRITIQGQDCVLHGSSHVEQFSLNDRFNLDVNISFQSEQAANSQTARLTTDGRIGIQIDIPPPFSMMPKPVLEGAGNTALQSTLGLLLGAVVKSMTSDYPKWAQTASQGQGQHPKQIGCASDLPALPPTPKISVETAIVAQQQQVHCSKQPGSTIGPWVGPSCVSIVFTAGSEDALAHVAIGHEGVDCAIANMHIIRCVKNMSVSGEFAVNYQNGKGAGT
ncbi:uncharacterized protein HaLaN_06057 [Haematococcus lacustris]|uniref:Uncharacterized protein n=1 Tax=Haematococcus lacustris TaxID=44745 RepID=A0A699YSH7_HAELA|nr:uncharacterized protein HaLaN_06057 [Haematococcus lacustris]